MDQISEYQSNWDSAYNNQNCSVESKYLLYNNYYYNSDQISYYQNANQDFYSSLYATNFQQHNQSYLNNNFLSVSPYDVYSNSVCSDNSSNLSESYDYTNTANLNYNYNLALPVNDETNETKYFNQDALPITNYIQEAKYESCDDEISKPPKYAKSEIQNDIPHEIKYEIKQEINNEIKDEIVNNIKPKLEPPTSPNIIKDFESREKDFKIHNYDFTFPKGDTVPSNPNISCELRDQDLWNKFNNLKTEMILTKNGRLMFPFLSINLRGLDPNQNYMIIADIIPYDNYRYKFYDAQWFIGSEIIDQTTTPSSYMHPSSPMNGSKWMRDPILFNKLKLTNRSDTEMV